MTRLTRTLVQGGDNPAVIPMPDWTDQQLVAQLKWELTHGMAQEVSQGVMENTKHWRGRVWKIAQEFDRRASPKPGAHRR